MEMNSHKICLEWNHQKPTENVHIVLWSLTSNEIKVKVAKIMFVLKSQAVVYTRTRKLDMTILMKRFRKVVR